MNKLEKLYSDNWPEPDDSGPLIAAIMQQLNEAIDHITALETEVDRLKGRTMYPPSKPPHLTQETGNEK